MTPTMDLTTASPSEIDTMLANLDDRHFDVMTKISQVSRDIKRIEDKGAQPWDHSTLTRLFERFEALSAEADSLREQMVPLNAEFVRRGGWTRAYLVQNNGGHIHSTMACSTCFPTTRFGWLPQVSGHDEAEIVDLAGEGACTVCYPSAPAVGPLRLQTPAQQAAKAERDAAKAARDSKRRAAGLSEDGSPVTVRWEREGTKYSARKEFKTRRAAEIWVVSALAGEEYDNPSQDAIETVLGLLADRGADLGALRAKADKKAAKAAAERALWA